MEEIRNIIINHIKDDHSKIIMQIPFRTVLEGK